MTITTPTLAQIQAASKASGVSIADLIIAIDKGLNESVKAEPTPQRTPRKPKADKSADTADWRYNDPSWSQLDRIDRAEEAILAYGKKAGIKLIKRGEDREMSIGTAGAASRYYGSLSAYTKKHGIRF